MSEQTHLHVVQDPHARLGDPFRAGGPLADNLREHNGWDSPSDDELRESMISVGWLDGHPAIQDEYGATITGHRRLAMAEELGIAPKILTIEFGSGDAADIKRLRTAWYSNQGAKPFSKGDRAKMSAYLASRGWTQMSIAEALNVAQSTIARDLSTMIHPSGGEQAEAAREAIAAGKRTNAPGAGRPRGTTATTAPVHQGRQPITVTPRDIVPPPPMTNLSAEVEADVQRDVAVWPMIRQHLSEAEIQRRTGLKRHEILASRQRWNGWIYGRTVMQRIG
jgi:hypothetical protein